MDTSFREGVPGPISNLTYELYEIQENVSYTPVLQVELRRIKDEQARGGEHWYYSDPN